MKTQVVRHTDGLGSLRAEWEQLLNDTPSPALPVCYPWIEAWWRSFGNGDRRLHVVAVRDDGGELLAIVPAMLMSSWFRHVHITKLALMVNGYTPFSGIVMRRGVDASKVVTTVLDEVTAEPDVDVVELTRIRASGDLHRAVREYLEASGLHFGEVPDINTPFIRIDADWPAFLAGLSPRFRKHVRTRLRSLGRAKGLELRRIPVADRTHPALQDMVEISSLSWKREMGSDIAADPEGHEFLGALCDTFGPTSDAVVWELLKDGTPVAFEFHVVYRGVTYPLRADHRADFSYLSPGAVLETAIVRSLFDEPRGAFEYNTCANAYDYLMRWTSTTRKHASVQVFSTGLVPAALHALEYKALPLLRPARARLRAAGRHATKGEDGDSSRMRSVKETPGVGARISAAMPGAGSAPAAAVASLARRGFRYGRDAAREVLSVVQRQRAFLNVRPNTSTLFLTYRCNSRCTTCTFWKRPHEEEISREIGFDEWKQIIKQLHDFGIRQTEIFGGNVLLRKQLLIDVLHYLKELDFIVHFPTNQLGLDEEVAEAMISCCSSIYVSTDGVGADQDAIRGTKGASKIGESAITQLRRLRRGDGPPPRLVCNTTVSKYNVRVLSSIVRYALDHGFDEIHFEYAGEHTPEHIQRSLIDGLVPTPYYVQQNGESILVDAEGARELKRGIRRLRRKYANAPIGIRSVNIDVLDEENLSQGTIPHRKCYVERLEVTVDPYGNAIACPFVNNYELGSLVDERLEDLWNNDRHRRFREIQNRGDLEMCRHCILGVERNPGIWTSLRRAHLTRIVPLVYRLPSARPERFFTKR